MMMISDSPASFLWTSQLRYDAWRLKHKAEFKQPKKTSSRQPQWLKVLQTSFSSGATSLKFVLRGALEERSWGSSSKLTGSGMFLCVSIIIIIIIIHFIYGEQFSFLVFWLSQYQSKVIIVIL